MKIKRITRFKIRMRGYDIDSVENFIQNEQIKSDEARLKQKERIAQLSQRCEELEKQLDDFIKRENRIKEAIVAATENAERMTQDIKNRYNEELKRLKLFRAKWTGAYEQLKERYRFDKDALNMESVAVSTQLELQNFLAQDFSLNRSPSGDAMEKYFLSEVDRLTKQAAKQEAAPPSKPAKKQEVAENSDAKKKEAAAFSFDEALNPTESLEEICRSLGLTT